MAHRQTCLTLFLFACSIVLLALAGATAHGAERRIIVFEDADYFGFDYETLRGRSLDQCKEACLGDADCRAFTYNTQARWCFLKNDLAELRSEPGAVAGRVSEFEIVAREQPARPDYLPHEIEREAAETVVSISQLPVDPAQGLHGLIAAAGAALSDNDPEKAASLYRLALRINPESFTAWTGLALSLASTQSDDYSVRYQLVRDGTAAAYNAWLNAPQARDRAQALALLARALERRSLFRPALEAYKASLLEADSIEVRTAFDALYAQYGFRVIDHTVDAESASPRVCVQFSEELQTGRDDYANFVTVDQSSPASVTMDGYQICIDGLKHGERYQIGLRSGIPAQIGETLQRPVALTVYVSDRQPSVRFTGRNFVLPRVGSHGIPLVSVNTEALEVTLYLIGERGLSGTLSQDQLFSQINTWTAQDIADNSGELVWEGVLDVESVLNEEVTTSFPIDEVLPERRPGVYVMVAKPTEGRDEYWNAQATQWFVVSDVGLSSLTGTDGLHVFARSLSDASALESVELTLLARNNSILGTATTDVQGHAQFAAGLTRGTGGAAAALLTASVGGIDFAFLDLTRPGFDLTDRGVEGRASPGPLDAFVYSERGVYRPGETVHIAALVRDADARAAGDTPLTFVFSRPDGVEFRREVARDQGLGGYQLDFDLQDSAMRGTWRTQVYVDPKGAQLAELQFLVEDFVPDRIEFDMATQATAFSRDDTTGIDIEGRFLYGAPASALRLEGEVAVRPVDRIDGFAGYYFGLGDEEVLPVRVPLEGLPATDAQGLAHLDVSLDSLPSSTRPLEAEVIVRMREAGGRAVQRTLTLPVSSSQPRIGIRPQFSDLRVREGETAQFDLIGVSADLETADLGAAKWELYRLERDFQWYEVNGTWSYETVTYSTRVADGTVELVADAPTRISAQVGWGRYRLEVTGDAPGGPVSSVDFYSGWYVDLAAADTPDILEIALDKPSYSPGDIARVNIAPRFSGEALVMVMNERLIDTYTASVGIDGASVDIPVGDDWGAGAYVTVVQFRPTDVQQSRMPGRAIGLQWLAVDTDTRTLGVTLDTPELIRPHDLLDVPVTLAGLGDGEEAYVTVAAVDVGILNLTGYEPPAPEDWYFEQRRLGMDIRDIYGQLIDGMLGVQGRIRSGGGEAPAGLTGTPPTQDLVALFSGIVTVDARGQAMIQFDVPEFTGTLRVMAVAWSKGSVGHGVSDVVVRDPVVLTLSGPRFLAPGDISQLRLEVDNLEGPDGDYDVSVSFSDEIDVAQPGVGMTVARGERQAAVFDIAALTPGIASLSVRLRNGEDIDISRSYRLGIRPSQPYVSEREVVELAPGASITLDAERLSGYVDGTASLTASISRAGAIDVPSLLYALDRYPYGCSEQITSRALPLLYLAQVAEQSGLGREEDLRTRVQQAIVDVLSHQSSNGGFGLWGPGSGDLWLDAYVSDFLTRARELGYDVPELALVRALDSLQNQLGYAPEVDGAGQDVAYALYVLARNRRASLGDLRYYVDTKLSDFGSAMAKAHLGAALALYGERARSRTAFDAALADLVSGGEERTAPFGYGTTLRDGAATLALAAETKPAPTSLTDLTRLVADLQARSTYTSTQENAWLLLAASGLLTDTRDLALEVDGEAHEGNFMQRLDAAYLNDEPLTVANRGDGAVEMVLTATGSPAAARPAGGNGFSITRQYYTLAGEPVGMEEVGQNERFVVVLTVTEQTAWRSRLLVADLLPAGFEIDNPNLVDGAETEAFAWLPATPGTAHLEFRDDRFVAALERSSWDDRAFTLAYVVRAVTPGHYVAPPALVEDMYRPHLNGWSETGRVEVIGPQP